MGPKTSRLTKVDYKVSSSTIAHTSDTGQLTQDERNAAKERVHEVEPPSDELLELRSRHPDPVVLGLVSRVSFKDTEPLTKSQLVAVDRETPFALNGSGMISGG